MKNHFHLAKKNQQGYSLIEILIAVALGAFMVTAAYFIFNTVLKEVYKVENNIGRMGTKVELRSLLENTCTQVNSFTHAQNNLPCLTTKTCTSGLQGNLKIYDEKAALFNDPGITTFDVTLRKCDSSLTSCTTTLSSAYRLVCSGESCKTPDIIMQLKFLKPVPTGQPENIVDSFDITLTYPQIYKNCQDAFSDGNTISDLYLIDPDGNGGICPFKVYCEISVSSGRSRALIGRAPTYAYVDLPRVAPPLEHYGHGVLQQEYITAIFNSLGATKKITVDVEESAKGDLTVPLTVTNISQTQQLANVTYCEYNNTSFVAATGATNSELKIGAKNNAGFVGFSTEIVSGKPVGFTCGNCSADYVCNLGGASCCQQQLKGALWLE